MDLITEKEESDIREKIQFFKNSSDFDEAKFIEYISKTLSDTEINKYLSLLNTVN